MPALVLTHAQPQLANSVFDFDINHKILSLRG